MLLFLKEHQRKIYFLPVTVRRAIPNPVLHSRKLCEATWEKSTFLTWIKLLLYPLMVDLSFTNSTFISVCFFFFWHVTGKPGHVHSCFSQLKVKHARVVFPNYNDHIASVCLATVTVSWQSHSALLTVYRWVDLSHFSPSPLGPMTNS